MKKITNILEEVSYPISTALQRGKGGKKSDRKKRRKRGYTREGSQGKFASILKRDSSLGRGIIQQKKK